MNTCKHDNNKILALGLCRRHYDALPERIAKRSNKTLLAHKYKSFKNTPEFRAYEKKYIKEYMETEDYKKWLLAKFRFTNKRVRRNTNILTADRAKYMKEYYKRFPEKYAQKIKANRARYYKKRGELLHDSQTKTRGNTRADDKQISQGFTGYSQRSERQTIPPQE